ncbi:hypothetical protein Ptr902_07822 [Pyrenophora tritici-repentis]|nr:hypothetical protein Ptr902_07822 [Pyrenophora tritici-repentis]
MSLLALSTEMDMRIIGYLDKISLIRMARVSRYYQSICERTLYKTIKINPRETPHGLRVLLLTLLRRKKLRLLVQRISVSLPEPHQGISDPNYRDISYPEDPKGSHLYDQLWKHVVEIRDAIDALVLHQLACTQEKIIWLSKIFEPYPLFDGTLSLILCWATNLRTLHMELCLDHPLRMTRHILQDIDWDSSEPSKTGRPFAKLQSLSLQGKGLSTVPLELMVLPNMKHLVVKGVSSPTALLVCPQHIETGNLRKIKLANVNINPEIITQAIQNSRYRDLTCLYLKGVGCNPWEEGGSWEVYDYRELKLAMLENLPLLQDFSWQKMECNDDPDFTAFGSFAEFKNLLFLSIDLHLLTAIRPEKTPGDKTPFLEELRQNLPSKLRSLRLFNIRFATVRALYADYSALRNIEKVAVLNEFVHAINSHSIQDLALWIRFQRFWQVRDAQTGIARYERQINVCVSVMEFLQAAADAMDYKVRLDFVYVMHPALREKLIDLGFDVREYCKME